jgi:Zn-dependent peptidase ImmA (M78 family)/DNA-binding XRE family transcriptional regulator
MFGGDRLAVAREFKAWSKEELARRANLTGAAIGQFERGTATPNSETLDRLAAALDVPVRFFAVSADRGSEVGAYFRSLRSTTLTQRRQARAFVQYVHQFMLALEQLVELPESQLPRFETTLDEHPDRIETFAARVRRHWQLDPHSPLPNVVRLLESRGIVVVRNYTADNKIDAFSVPFTDRAVIVLSAIKGKHDRSRFDASHELAHLVMHHPDEEATKHVEAQAHRFAAAFLLPADAIHDELPTRTDWRRLLALKEEWGVSVAALLMRARDLGRMSRDQYVNAMKALSARGWRTDEPGTLPPEEPTLLRRAIEVAEDAGYRLDELAHEAALPATFVVDLINCATDPRPRVRI